MPRLIDADALRATFSNMTIFGYGDYVSGQKMMAAPTIDPEKHSQWISVKDRLPDVHKTKSGYEKTVVIATNGKTVRAMIYERACIYGKTKYRWKWMWDRIYHGNDITQWMPLPEPPDEDENDKTD